MKAFSILPILTFVLLLHTPKLLASTKTPIINLPQGKILGTDSSRTYSYKGIPYAAPPVGNNRWKAPLAPKKWEGIFEATEFGSACLQAENFNPDAKIMGQEDCLTLNIWKPSEPTIPRPVMVFFHGGSFSFGSNTGEIGKFKLYDGTQLSSRGNVVVVTVNYRLGALGFLAHPELTSEAGNDNLGLRDQIESLKWVKENIAQFGGDPDRILVFGESAGAFSVGGLLVSPLAEGLFSKAIMQSGSVISDTREKAEITAIKFSEAAGCSPGDQGKCLQNLSPTQIMRAMGKVMKNQGVRITFGPYIDGAVLPESPLKLLKEGKFNHVPLLIGSNADEMTTLLIPELMQTPIITKDEYAKILKNDHGEALAEKIQEQYPLKDFRSPLEALKNIYGDSIFHCPAGQLAGILSDANLPVWRYVFNHTFHTDPFRIIGAGHAMELPYVFHNFPYFTIYAPDLFELRLSEEMIRYWTNFAETGNPNSKNTSKEWPIYNARTEKYLELDVFSKGKAHYREDACEFWEKVSEVDSSHSNIDESI